MSFKDDSNNDPANGQEDQWHKVICPVYDEESTVLAPLSFEQKLEVVKENAMVSVDRSSHVTTRDVLEAIWTDRMCRFIFLINALAVISNAAMVFFGTVPLFSFICVLISVATISAFTVVVTQDWKRKSGVVQKITPAVKGYLEAHKDTEDDLRRKAQGFNRALEARNDSTFILKDVDPEVRQASDEAWRRRRAEIVEEINVYFVGMREVRFHEVELDQLRGKAETYKRLEAAMQQYPDSGKYAQTVDVSVYQEVTQALHEIEEEADRLGVTLADLGISPQKLLTGGKQAVLPGLFFLFLARDAYKKQLPFEHLCYPQVLVQSLC